MLAGKWQAVAGTATEKALRKVTRGLGRWQKVLSLGTATRGMGLE